MSLINQNLYNCKQVQDSQIAVSTTDDIMKQLNTEQEQWDHQIRQICKTLGKPTMN